MLKLEDRLIIGALVLAAIVGVACFALGMSLGIWVSH